MPTRHANRLIPTVRRVVLARQAASRTDGELLGDFVTNRDSDAFAELVRRHGPMVLGVCRRVVGELTTAEDAFQAAFLVLARRAASVRPREQVGNWLYGVAYRTALKARMVLARQRAREKQVEAMPEPPAPSLQPAWSDIQLVIDEELAKLPAKLRLPVVLCDLEGRPQREVAKHLKVPPATLATRLASARRTLASRLTRRGVTLSGGVLASLLGTHASAIAVPHSLTAGLVGAAESVAVGGAIQSLVSAHAIQLSEGVMRTMFLAKLKMLAVVVATAMALTTGLGVGLMPATASDNPEATTTNKPAPGTIHKLSAQLTPKPKPQTPTQSKETDDATFLRRLCIDVRGTPPTDVEMWFFVADDDNNKRAKVVEWVTDDDATRLALAKQLGVPVEHLRIVRVIDNGVEQRAVIVENAKEQRLIVAKEYLHKAIINKVDLTPAKPPIVSWVDGTKALTAPETEIARLDLRPWYYAPATQLRVEVDPPLGTEAEMHGLRFLLGDDLTVAGIDIAIVDSDAEFLKRVLTDVRGSGPTTLETKYFTEDKDPKKREKLLDTLLKDPATQKKLGDAWKKKMLAFAPPAKAQGFLFYDFRDVTKPAPGMWVPQVTPLKPAYKPAVIVPGVPLDLFVPQPPKPPVPPVPPAKKVIVEVVQPDTPQADKVTKLVDELIAAKKSDEAILESLTLSGFSRLPTESEKKLALAAIANAKDRKAAWVSIARALR